MGYNLNWLAIDTGTAEEAVSLLGIDAGQGGEGDPVAGIECLQLPHGWTVLLFDIDAEKMPDAADFARRAKGRSIVRAEVYETVMVCSAFCFTDGKPLWSAAHDPEKGATHLEAQGTLPPDFDRLRQTALEDQAGEESEPEHLRVDHMFEVPLLLAQHVCGYKHDEEEPDGTTRDRVMISAPWLPKRRGLLAWLLGR